MIRKCFLVLVVLALGRGFASGQETSNVSDTARVAIEKAREALSARSVRLAATALSIESTQASTWQREYDDAAVRRVSGRKKIIIGAIVAGAGMAATIVGPMMASDSLSGASGMVTMGLLADLAGTGLIVWGWVQNSDAKADIRALESRQPPTRTGAAIPITQNHAFQFSVGQQTSVQYRVTW